MTSRRRLFCGVLLVVALVGQLLLIVRLRDHRLLSDYSTGTGGVADSLQEVVSAPDVVLYDSAPHLIIILSSSPRSGSSLLGEILSTSDNTAYFFEPFYYHVKNNMSVSRLPGEEVRHTLRQLLTCRLNQTEVLREAKYRRFIWRPAARPRFTPSAAVLAQRCAGTSTRVVKLVRPRLSQLLPLLDDAELGRRLRLVHLVRDPRGTLNSQLHAAGVWQKLRHDLRGYCAGTRADLAAARPLRDPRYLRVHYEQLAVQPRRLAAELYRGLRLSQPASLHAYFHQHMNNSQPETPPAPPQQRKRTWRGPAPPNERRSELEERRSAGEVRRSMARAKRSVAQGRRSVAQARRSAAKGRLPAVKQQLRVTRARQSVQQLQQRKQQADARSRAHLEYYSTYRGSDFDPYHWRKELKPEALHQIERDCADVIAELEAEVSPSRASAEPTSTAVPPR